MGSVGSMSCFDAVRKMIPDRMMIFVVAEYSQDLMAKKKPAIVMSAITAGTESRRVVVARPVDWNRNRSSSGVMAFCRFGAGSALS
jgi:mRNA-degrading endonuclease toxin of MazEF toxin-antitoxin module